MILLLALAVVSGAPDKDAGTALVESTVRAALKDPDSAKFTWPNGFVYGSYRKPFERRVDGWITCGTFNAKNGYGGYVGEAAVLGVVLNGAVIKFDIDEPGARSGAVVADACAKLGLR